MPKLIVIASPQERNKEIERRSYSSLKFTLHALVLFVSYFAFYDRLKRLFLHKEIWFTVKSGTAQARLFEPSHFWKWDGSGRPTEIGSDAYERNRRRVDSSSTWLRLGASSTDGGGGSEV